jgi:hypothetical protein
VSQDQVIGQVQDGGGHCVSARVHARLGGGGARLRAPDAAAFFFLASVRRSTNPSLYFFHENFYANGTDKNRACSDNLSTSLLNQCLKSDSVAKSKKRNDDAVNQQQSYSSTHRPFLAPVSKRASS